MGFENLFAMISSSSQSYRRRFYVLTMSVAKRRAV
jgi:hypothetical protein